MATRKSLGPFRLVSVVDKCAFGALYTALLADDDEPEADETALIRFVNRTPRTSESDMSAIEEVGEWAMELEHESIVAITGLVEEDDQLGVVSEYLPGEPLSALLRRASVRQAPIPPPVALRITLDILDALGALHDQAELVDPSYLYGGIAADTVLVGLDGQSRLLEVGVSAVVQATEGWGQDPKRAAYASPEQLDGVELGPASDLFTVSVMLWEMLRNRRLFHGTTHAAIRRKMRRPVPQPKANVPDAVRDVIVQTLQSDPAERFSSAEAMANALSNSGAEVADHEEVATVLAELCHRSLDDREQALERAADRLARGEMDDGEDDDPADQEDEAPVASRRSTPSSRRSHPQFTGVAAAGALRGHPAPRGAPFGPKVGDDAEEPSPAKPKPPRGRLPSDDSLEYKTFPQERSPQQRSPLQRSPLQRSQPGGAAQAPRITQKSVVEAPSPRPAAAAARAEPKLARKPPLTQPAARAVAPETKRPPPPPRNTGRHPAVQAPPPPRNTGRHATLQAPPDAEANDDVVVQPPPRLPSVSAPRAASPKQGPPRKRGADDDAGRRRAPWRDKWDALGSTMSGIGDDPTLLAQAKSVRAPAASGGPAVSVGPAHSQPAGSRKITQPPPPIPRPEDLDWTVDDGPNDAEPPQGDDDIDWGEEPTKQVPVAAAAPRGRAKAALKLAPAAPMAPLASVRPATRVSNDSAPPSQNRSESAEVSFIPKIVDALEDEKNRRHHSKPASKRPASASSAPPPPERSSAGRTVVGLLLAAAAIVLFVAFGLPRLRPAPAATPGPAAQPGGQPTTASTARPTTAAVATGEPQPEPTPTGEPGEEPPSQPVRTPPQVWPPYSSKAERPPSGVDTSDLPDLPPAPPGTAAPPPPPPPPAPEPPPPTQVPPPPPPAPPPPVKPPPPPPGAFDDI